MPDPEGDKGGTLSRLWGRVISEMRAKDQTLAALTYEDARVEEFDGKRLVLSFEHGDEFSAELALIPTHVFALGKIVGRRFGSAPRVSVLLKDGSLEHDVPPGTYDPRYAVGENVAEQPESLRGGLPPADVPGGSPGPEAGGEDGAKAKTEEAEEIEEPKETKKATRLADALGFDLAEIVADIEDDGHPDTAAVFAAAVLEDFDGNTLSISFPESRPFHARLAGSAVNTTRLRYAVEGRHGVSPCLMVLKKEPGGKR